MALFDGIEGITPELQAAIEANAKKDYEGYESPDQVKGLKDSRDSLLSEKKAADQATQEAVRLAEQAKLDASVKSGDVDALTKSYTAKLEESDARFNALLKTNESNAINAEVTRMAAELGGDNAALLAPHIAQRLRYEDGQVKVTDTQGGLTISTLSDLTTEFRNNPMFASAIVGSKASGGGANAGSHGGGAANVGQTETAAHLGTKIKGFNDLPVR